MEDKNELKKVNSRIDELNQKFKEQQEMYEKIISMLKHLESLEVKFFKIYCHVDYLTDLSLKK